MNVPKISIIICLFGFMSITGFSQNEEDDYGELSEKLIGTYFELGYISENSDFLGSGLLFKSAIEYRLKKTNHIFIRLNTDNYDVDYLLTDLENFSAEVTGSASMTDIILGPGYRKGNDNTLFYILIQSGLKLYSFPAVSNSNDVVLVFPDGDNVFTTRITAGFEYYFDSTFAFTVEVFQNQVWEEKGFWKDKKGAWGISVGLVGSFF